jgi:AcrR family transcriptional regulator
MPRSAETNQRMRDERRERILAVGLQLFAARGLAATRIGDIAERAEMAQGLLYHYFPSKEAIYLELIRGAFARMNAAARGLEKLALPPREKVRRALAELVAGLERHEDTARFYLLIAQASASEATPRAVQALIRKERAVPYQVMARIFEAGQKGGVVREGDPEELAVLFWVLIRGLAIHRAAWGEGFRFPGLPALERVFLEEE